MPEERTYIAIDLKSFYASVECVQRGLDPLKANLVVADVSRTEKTICLAVSPSLKSYGIPGRARLFEVNQKVNEINSIRKSKIPGHRFAGKSIYPEELKKNPFLELDFIAATPQMAKYMNVSTLIYNIYLKYVSEEDIHVYSIDEVFIDATDYLAFYKMNARQFAMKLVLEVLETTGITATCGIGTNLYLCKIAMDIEAKHIEPDEYGVRIAELNEMSYRQRLWNHRPITDFWRVGKGISKRLEGIGIHTMGDIALCSVQNEDILYRLFGVNSELLIDHAWGVEPVTIADIKAYVPENNSLSSGQVLQKPYSFESGRLILREMTDKLSLDLVRKHLVTDHIVLNIGYDNSNVIDVSHYMGELQEDRYGRVVPKSAHGSVNLGRMTSSSKIMVGSAVELYNKIIDSRLTVRRINVVAGNVKPESLNHNEPQYEQMNLFTDYEALDKARKQENEELKKERSLQEALINIKDRFGSNSILKGLDYTEDATARERNSQVGGHKA